MNHLVIFALFDILVFIFTIGFFPMQFSTTEKNHKNDRKYSFFNISRSQKTVIMIIDALRYDFISSPNGKQNMPFTTGLLENEKACLIKTKAEAPTVTMPRIKAITTGTVPNFIDIVLNLGTSELKESNIIENAYLNNFKIWFYGDDTWLKLFPNMFTKSEGTTSFFATDYTEVDNNVTRHLDQVFSENNPAWDILILHYLGLDHIGHLEGPFSKLISPKLREMDVVVKRIYEFLLQLEVEDPGSPLFIVSGDHGMKDSGSHGGVSYSEVTVPLISLGHPCRYDYGREVAAQIDVTSTLSLLLGLPIPDRNIGKLIPQLMYNMDNTNLVKMLYLNRRQLLKIKSPSESELEDIDKLYIDWLNNKSHVETEQLIKILFDEVKVISDDLIKSRTEFKIYLLTFCTVCMWILCFTFFISFKITKLPNVTSEKFFLIGSLLYVLSLSSTSFIEEEHQLWYFIWITVCCLIVFESKLNFNWLIVCVLHRVLRMLNQTGDKWSHLPDISDYLCSDYGRFWLLLVFSIGLILLVKIIIQREKDFIVRALSISSVVCVFCYRIAVDSFPLDIFHFYNKSRGVVEVSTFWLLLCLLTISLLFLKRNIFIPFMLVSALLHRPHNTILPPLQYYFSLIVHNYYNQPKSTIYNCIAHYWLGHAFYFYQGNSNSIANIDISSGYVGLDHYQPVYVGTLILVHTYSSHIFSYILSPKLDKVWLFLVMFQISFYFSLVVLHRHHLFIWSVLAPKLLYQITFLSVISVLVFINYLFSKILLFYN